MNSPAPPKPAATGAVSMPGMEATTDADYRLLVESVTDYAIFRLDPQGRIASWNKGAQRLKGYKPEEIIGQHFSVFYPESLNAAGWPAKELELATAHGNFEDEGWRIRKDGSRFWASVVITALYDEHQRHVGFAKVTRDLTEKKRISALEDEGRRITTFLAMLGHELRNPLAPISNALAIMGLKADDAKIVTASRQIIDRQVQHLTRLVDDLLDVSRITSGKIHIERHQVELRAIVMEGCETASALIKSKSQELRVEVGGDNLWVLADRARMVQVISNIVVNAAKYTPERGHIAVRIGRNGPYAEVSVKDNGQGIAPDLAPYVFDLFVQGEQDVARSTGGLGLGLSLVKQLVMLHGGNVRVESAGPGHGSEFIVNLPAIEPAGKAASASIAIPMGDLQKNVLVVDDNHDSANTMSLLLQSMGYRSSVAYDGLSAVEAIKSAQPDAVLLDIGLPGISGYDVARIVSQECAQPPLLIALTGYSQEKDREESRKAGFHEHIAKPVHITQLQEILAKAFAGPATRSQGKA